MNGEERQFQVAEKLGGLTSAVQGIGKKLDDYCERNEAQHSAMWLRIDEHGNKLNWIMGVVAAVSFAFSSLILWIRSKF